MNEKSSILLPTCAICYQEGSFVALPCCHRDDSTMKFCKHCIEILCNSNSGFGRCPSCRTFISIHSDGNIISHENIGECVLCRQERAIVQNNCCDTCLYGRRFILSYECDRCHRVQRIPHPMWRYQPTPDTFGTETWACHQGCSDYTHWKVVASDLSRVPLEDVPEPWGRREEFFERIREIRRNEMNRDNEGRDENVPCIIN